MKQAVTVPSPGESVSGGILAKWLKPDGAAVQEGDELFELETDKATMSVPASTGGVLTHAAAEGAEVTVGQVVATIDTAGTADAAPAAKPSPAPDAPPPPAAQAEPAPAAPVPPAPAAAATAPVRPPAPRPAPPQGRQTREKMSMLRKRIAENLVQSQRNAAHLSTFNEIDMDRFMTIRKTHGESFEKRHGVKLGFMSMFVKACSRALTDFPGVNAMIDGDEIVYHHYCNIGVAVSTDRGLIVPVLRDAERKTFAEIELEIRALADRAREKKLGVDDLTGGTFTITNGGIFGSLLSTPIPTPPQTAILGMHTIQKRPVVVNDAIVIRPMMYVALTYDHRVIDGKEAVGFLVKIKQIVEEPDSLLFDL
ncbi:MAG: dihydrolipoyllysine-residue succinyltransferase [Lentisphaerae bacterium]|nr:dihydrolipoyllysine-residue succinyltransferase [Lentisphaerota bacterium]